MSFLMKMETSWEEYQIHFVELQMKCLIRILRIAVLKFAFIHCVILLLLGLLKVELVCMK